MIGEQHSGAYIPNFGHGIAPYVPLVVNMHEGGIFPPGPHRGDDGNAIHLSIQALEDNLAQETAVLHGRHSHYAEAQSHTERNFLSPPEIQFPGYHPGEQGKDEVHDDVVDCRTTTCQRYEEVPTLDVPYLLLPISFQSLSKVLSRHGPWILYHCW